MSGRKVYDVLNDKLAYVAPVLYNIQKKKMGLHGKEIPQDLKEEFVKGMIKLSRSEFEIDIDAPSYEQKLRTLVEMHTQPSD